MKRKKYCSIKYFPLFISGLMFGVIGTVVYFAMGLNSLAFFMWIASLLVMGRFLSHQQDILKITTSFLSKNSYFLLLGFLFWILASSFYFFYGFSFYMFICWLVSLFVTVFYFSKIEPSPVFKNIFNRIDSFFLIGLILIFVPLYFFSLYNTPWQMHTDEIAIMDVSGDLTGLFMDPFGESDYYYGFPHFAFILLGGIAKLLGGISLSTIRAAQGVLGLITVLVSYFLFRQILNSRGYGFGAAILLGGSHAFLAISRMGLWTHTAVIVEVSALLMLLTGFKQRSLWVTFVGGAFAGVSLYVYFAARTSFVVWILFLCLVPFVLNQKALGRMSLKYALVGILGFIFVASPMLIATFKKDSESHKYIKEKILLFSEGRQTQLGMSNKETVREAWLENISKGLWGFNKNIVDHGTVYINYGHGFVDPITGMLIWFGFLCLLIKMIFGIKRTEESLFTLVGFLFIWLFMSLFVIQAPNYTRLMVVLPFVVLLCIEAIRTSLSYICKYLERISLKLSQIISVLFPTIIILLIAVLNSVIYYDFIKKGDALGDDVGGTYRYMETKKEWSEYTYYLSASDEHPYYHWGIEGYWKYWMERSVQEGQHFEFIKPDSLANYVSSLRRPFTLFVSEDLWKKIQNEMVVLYPKLNIVHIQPDGSRLAIEVL